MDELLTKAEQDGITPRALAERLGITPLYLSFLSNGDRKVPALGDDILRAAAEFLGKPLAEIDHLAEKRTIADYYYGGDVEERLNLLYGMMKQDPIWGPFVPVTAEWMALTLNVKLLIGTMYETFARTKLLAPPRLRPIVHE